MRRLASLGRAVSISYRHRLRAGWSEAGCRNGATCPVWEEYTLGAGGLLAALQRGGGVVRLGFDEPFVDFKEWARQHGRFGMALARGTLEDVADRKLVKFTQNQERLSRTREDARQLAEEPRSIFDLRDRVLGAPAQLEFFRDEFVTIRDKVVPLVRRELAAVAPWVATSPLDNSIVRNNFYPPRGVCGEHTDYGLCSVQVSTHDGLEVFIGGEWHKAPGGWLLYAGDMLEVLTNGCVPAVKHRVQAPRGGQSHVLFVQPSNTDVVAPVEAYASGQPVRREAVKYEDWHNKKKRAAFA